MKALRLFNSVIGYLLPLVMLASAVGHTHTDRDNDHCDYCSTVGANRRRVLPSSLTQEQTAAGGRPGENDFHVAMAAVGEKSPSHPAALNIELTALAAPIPLQPIAWVIAPRQTVSLYGHRLPRRAPPRELTPRAPPIQPLAHLA
jgi:hypothetical protein